MSDKKEAIESRVQLTKEHQQAVSDFLEFLNMHYPELQFKISVSLGGEKETLNQVVLRIESKQRQRDAKKPEDNIPSLQCFSPLAVTFNMNHHVADMLSSIDSNLFAKTSDYELPVNELMNSKPYQTLLGAFKAKDPAALQKIQNYIINFNDYVNFKSIFERKISDELVEHCKVLGSTMYCNERYRLSYLCHLPMTSLSFYIAPSDFLCSLNLKLILESAVHHIQIINLTNERPELIKDRQLVLRKYLNLHGITHGITINEKPNAIVVPLQSLKQLCSVKPIKELGNDSFLKLTKSTEVNAGDKGDKKQVLDDVTSTFTPGYASAGQRQRNDQDANQHSEIEPLNSEVASSHESSTSAISTETSFLTCIRRSLERCFRHSS